jgi:hypothetical protein
MGDERCLLHLVCLALVGRPGAGLRPLWDQAVGCRAGVPDLVRSSLGQEEVLVCPLWGEVAPVVPVGGLLLGGEWRTDAEHNSAQSQVGVAGTGGVGGPTVFLGKSSCRPPGGRELHRSGMRGRKAPGGHSTSRGWRSGQGLPLLTPQRVQHLPGSDVPGVVGASSKQGTSGRQPEIPPQGV